MLESRDAEDIIYNRRGLWTIERATANETIVATKDIQRLYLRQVQFVPYPRHSLCIPSMLIPVSFVLSPDLLTYLFSMRFPEVYAPGTAPANYGHRDEEKKAGTPVYRFGWVVAREELYQALHGRPSIWHGMLSHIYIGTSKRLYARWIEQGYDNNEYK